MDNGTIARARPILIVTSRNISLPHGLELCFCPLIAFSLRAALVSVAEATRVGGLRRGMGSRRFVSRIHESLAQADGEQLRESV